MHTLLLMTSNLHRARGEAVANRLTPRTLASAAPPPARCRLLAPLGAELPRRRGAAGTTLRAVWSLSAGCYRADLIRRPSLASGD